jgi:transposase
MTPDNGAVDYQGRIFRFAYRGLVRSMNAVEREALEARIRRGWDRDSIIYKDQHDNVLDGHNRLDVIFKLVLDMNLAGVRVVTVPMADIDAVRDFIEGKNHDRRHLTPAEVADWRQRRRKVIDSLNGAGLSSRQIAAEVGCSHGTVRREINDAVTPVTVPDLAAAPHPGGRRKGMTTEKVRERRQEVARLWNEGMSRADLAARFGISTSAVSEDLKAVRAEGKIKLAGRSARADLRRKTFRASEKLVKEKAAAASVPPGRRRKSVLADTRGAWGRLRTHFGRLDQAGRDAFIAEVPVLREALADVPVPQ